MIQTFAKIVCVFLAFGSITLQAANPVIALEGKDTLDFGAFPANIRQSGTFKILNQGNAPLKIINLRKTCGCAAVKIDKQDLDCCITIRTALIKDGKAHVQAGGGWVDDSTPENEYQETVNKSKAMLKAVAMAESFGG